MSEGFFEAIEELERMTREPSDVLEEMNDKLSSRELQLVLVYFSQEGRDSWSDCDVGDVVDLLVDMDCVGLKPGFSMIEKVISMYWEMDKREGAFVFVKEVLSRGISYEDDGEGQKGGPAGYLAWKMMVEGNYGDAIRLVIDLRESGLKPEIYSYLMAMTAIVKELNEFAKALWKLKGFAWSGLVAELDTENIELIEKYQSDLLGDGIKLSNWAIQEGSSSINGLVHERLLAMYICAGHGLGAERQLWEMKLAGKEADGDLYDIVLAICASRKETSAILRLLSRLEVSSSLRRRKILSWLLRVYIKGGHIGDAAETVVKMLDLGLYPKYLDRAAVLQELRKRIHQPGNIRIYIDLCKRLYDASLIGPCLLYLYMKKYKLWVIRML
ncbi:Pentatricopeptide repeat-containing protein [Hibiscus syriacus]|uniref:Pentatricopeptide repeat-containing protein n=1 Tax=Hibiscus syriacus TaxID=106335 RepID=A0A6A3B2Q1_HIBSY|nr:Pentatricopeptide repeat-containing protein [Hibiscus syriacus]